MSVIGGEIFELEAPSNNIASMLVILPTTISFDHYPYLSLRVRATKGSNYFVRPMLNETRGYENSRTLWKSALEARPGTGTGDSDPWEIVTLNMREYMRIYQPAATTMNQISLVVGPAIDNPPAESTVRLQIDYMGVNAGILADTLTPDEFQFTNGLDDDGDGLVDRDDDHFRETYPKSVHVNYQSLMASLERGGWRGNRKPGVGQNGSNVVLDPHNFSPNVPGKRHIPSTYYPLDFVTHPSYEPPGYVEFADQNEKGVWNGCNLPHLGPTEQFPQLDYNLFGAVEEYDDAGVSWVSAETALARRYGVDGFIHDDSDVGNSNGSLASWKVMGDVLEANAANVWRAKPMTIASFLGLGPADANPGDDVINMTNDLSNIIGSRPNLSSAYLHYNGKPAVFVYPMASPMKLAPAQWEEVYNGLRQPYSNNYDGAFSVPAANPSANTITLRFSAFQNNQGTAFSGHLDVIEWYDKNLSLLGAIDFGKPETRAQFISGFGIDYPATSIEPFDYTYIQGETGTPTAGAASFRSSIPANAFFMKMKIKGLDQAMTGQPQQYCTINVNGVDGITFPERVGWSSYLFRMRDLPAEFEEATTSDQALPELPVSLWGQDESLVRRLDDPNKSRGFEGVANYATKWRDLRIDVSHPYLRADTARPGFDDSGDFYYCDKRIYLTPRQGGMRYRQEWEQIVADNPDMAIITGWNEFAEGTNIHPDIEHGYDALRLTLTYSLIYKGVVETRQFPSVTGFKILRFDTEGATREIEFSIGASEVIKFTGPRFGLWGSEIISITRDGTPVAVNSPEAWLEGGILYPGLTINTPGPSNYRITYRDASNANVADVAVDLSAWPNSVSPGGQITYTLVVKNNGPATATGVAVAQTLPQGTALVSVSNPALVQEGDYLRGTVGDLPGGGNVSISVVVTASASAPILSSTASVMASETDPKPESNRHGSQAFVAIGTPPPVTGPDFVASWTAVKPICKKVCKLKGKVTFVNQGDVKSAPFSAGIFLSNDAVFDGSDALLRTVNIKPTKPGKARTKAFNVTVPEGFSGKFIVVVVDNAGAVGEKDENNNVAVFGPIP